MNMFPSLPDTIPKNRSDFVNDLELPDVTVSPYIWSPDLTPRESISSSDDDGEDDEKSVSSASSLALSRAMTDSEIDYGRYRRWKNRSFSDPWDEMKSVLNRFPQGYLDSLYSFSLQDTESGTESSLPKPGFNEELRLKMERFFEEECRVFSPDDPGLAALEEALRDADYIVDSDIESSLI